MFKIYTPWSSGPEMATLKIALCDNDTFVLIGDYRKCNGVCIYIIE